MIRYGIIGFGHHAVKRMIPGFAEARDSQLIALWRRNLEKGRENGHKFAIPHVFATAEELPDRSARTPITNGSSTSFSES